MSRKNNAANLKRARDRAKAKGLCYVCRCRVPRPGVSTCDDCIARAKAWQKATGNYGNPQTKREYAKREYAQRRRAERKAAGLCMRCGKAAAAPGYAQCPMCLDHEATRARDRYAGAPSPGKCTICGLVGHNRARHNRPGLHLEVGKE